MRSKFWKKFNFNKWSKDMPDCQIRSICAGIGLDYEVACRLLKVKCTPGEGFSDEYGIDLDDIHDRLSNFLGPIEDMLDYFDNPADSLLHGVKLEDWIEQHADDNKKYLVYIDDNKVNDGGHIVYVCCKGTKSHFVDTFDCSQMFVQAWCLITSVIPKTSKYHWKFDEQSKKFI